MFDPKGRILSANRRLAEILGVPHELLAARDYPALREAVLQLVTDAEAVARGMQYLADHPDEYSRDELLFKDGRVIDRITAAFKTADGETLGRISFFRDFTERRKAEESLRASEERFRLLVEEAPDAVLLYDFDQDRLVAVNKAAERLFGVSREEILRGGALSFYPPEQPDGRPVAETFRENGQRALAGEEVTYERWIRRPSGEVRITRATLVRLPSTIRMTRASHVDITDQRAAEAKVAEIRREMSLRQEAERHAIARELHDSLGQYLAAMNIKLGVLTRSEADATSLKSGLADLTNLTSAVGAEVSRLAWELRPISLDDIGLEAAIRNLGVEWAQRSGLRFELHVAVGDRRLPSDVETTLYRVVQEAITNVVKHAKATRVGVILRASAHDVVMIIEDDGISFDPEAARSKAARHFGLLGMRERLTAVHGELEIESSPGAGTTLLVRVALDEHAAAVHAAGASQSWAEALLKRAETERAETLNRQVEERAAALARAIAERQEADARLVRTTALLRAIGENSPDAIYAKDTSGRFLYANPAVLAIIGKAPEIVLGHTDAEWHSDPEQAAAVMANDQRIMQGGVPEVIEENWDDADRGRRTFRSAKAPFVLEDGLLAGIVCVSSDITER